MCVFVPDKRPRTCFQGEVLGRRLYGAAGGGEDGWVNGWVDGWPEREWRREKSISGERAEERIKDISEGFW